MNLATTMFDDDDDVEPPDNYVDNYYFEKSKDNPVCFSVLPIKFDENEEVGHCDYKELNLRGLTDNNLKEVFKKVVAWRVELDCQEPKISVLSSEGKWIQLMKPRKCYYEKRARSILITVQMLHFVRKWPRKQERSLFDHLSEVFDKYGTRPTGDDIRKHHHLIKLFMDRDPILLKSKTIRCFIEDASMRDIEPIPRRAGTKEQFIVSDESLESSDDSDDCSYSDDDNSDDNDHDDTDKDTDTDTDTDGNAADDGTDMICAICDDGGKLLGCEGQCKRSFHPRVKHGRKSNCRTLRFTSAELKLKESGTFLCENCEHNEHQCFKCGELEPSYGPNAKVFQCNKESCGHFYHPKCIAVLLEPEDTDGACKLEERIADGMSFTCPVHWCFKCGKMEDRTQRELQFAVCRRCPRSYHIECLPSEISFETKDKGAPKLAWKIKTRSYFYCLHHGIDATIGSPSGEHIKFPSVPKVKKTKNLSKKDVKVTGKRKKSANQFSTKSTELANVSPRGEIKQTRRVARNSSSEHTALKQGCAVKRLKKDLQFELPVVDVAASLSGAKTVEGKEEQPGTPSSFVMGKMSKSASCVVDGETEKRVTSTAEKVTSAGTSQDMATKGILRQPSRIETDGMSECFVQITDKLHWYMQPGDTIVDLCFNMDNFSRLMEEILEDVGKRCNFKNYDIFQHKKDMCFEESTWVTMQPSDLPHGLNLVIVLDLPLGIQAVSANKFVDKVLTFKPRLIIIVSPADTERLDCKEEPYHLIWEYNQHIFGKPLYQPGDVDVNDKGKNGLHVIPLSLSLWSCPDKAEENRRIAGKHGHLNVGHTTHSVMLKDPPVDKGAKWDNEIFPSGKEDTSEREQLRIPSEDTFHANQEQNDALQSLYKDKHANGSGGGNKLRSGKESDTHQGENACGHNSVARQETEIWKRENRMTDSAHEENTSSGKEKIPRDDSNKGTAKPDLVDGLPPEKHVEVVFVHKTTTNRVDAKQECIDNVAVDVDGSYARQQPKSPHCNDNLKGTEMDIPGDNSRKTREQKKVIDAKRLNSDRKRKGVHMKNRRDAHHEDDRTAHPQVHSDPQRIDNHIPDVLDYSSVNSPSHNDDQRAAEASVCSKSREKGESNRILESRDTISKISSRRQLPVRRRNRRNAPDRSKNYSPGWGRADDSENYPAASNQHRYEQIHHGDYSNNDNFDRMRWSSHQPAFHPANSGPNRRYSPYSHPREEYGSRGSSSPSYPRRRHYNATARQRSPSYPRRPRGSERVSYETDWNAVPLHGNLPDTEYDGYATDSRYGYHAMDSPVDRYYHQEYDNGAYRPQTNFGEEEHAVAYGRHRNDYGWRPDYHLRNSFDWDHRSSARGTVTDWYAPHLEHTNHQIPGQGSIHEDYMYGRSKMYMNMNMPYY